MEWQSKTHIFTLEKSIVIKDKEIGKLTSNISQLKNKKRDIKKSTKHHYHDLEDVIFAKDLKIITLNDQIILFNLNAIIDVLIEPSSFISFHDAEYWAGKRKDAKNNLSIRKKYTF